MPNDVKPALTREEWAAPKVYWRQPRNGDEGCGVEMTDPPKGMWLWVFDDSWSVTLPNESRHALAALALHGQPFGFSEHDAKFLREFAANWFPNQVSAFRADTTPARNALIDLAARIEALLPPEAPDAVR